MTKLIYEIDPHNRLIIQKGEGQAGIFGFRHVIEGRLKIGKDNALIYHIKAPSKAMARELNLPYQLKFKGSWSLTEEHDLRLTFDKWKRQRIGDELTLKGEIVKIDAHSLVFAVTQKTGEDTASIYSLGLEGSWRADDKNRLTFRVKREKNNYNLLVFDGMWEINRNHQIIYSYEKRITKRAKRRKRHSLLFKGFWNLTKREALTYQLDIKDRSTFDFRVGHGIIEGYAIKFETGIGISRRQRPVRKDIILYGRWRIKSGAGLIFEMRYGDGHVNEMLFEAEAKLINDYEIKFALKNSSGEDLGMAFTLSKTMLKGSGESFIRVLLSKEKRAIYIGSGFTW